MRKEAISPLRARMIEDMTARKLVVDTQRSHIRACKRFAAFLKRSPETATSEDVRRFQLHHAPGQRVKTSRLGNFGATTGVTALIEFNANLRRDAGRRSHGNIAGLASIGMLFRSNLSTGP